MYQTLVQIFFFCSAVQFLLVTTAASVVSTTNLVSRYYAVGGVTAHGTSTGSVWYDQVGNNDITYIDGPFYHVSVASAVEGTDGLHGFKYVRGLSTTDLKLPFYFGNRGCCNNGASWDPI